MKTQQSIILCELKKNSRNPIVEAAKELEFGIKEASAPLNWDELQTDKNVFAIAAPASVLTANGSPVKKFSRWPNNGAPPIIAVLNSDEKQKAVDLLQNGTWGCLMEPFTQEDASTQLTKLMAERSESYNPFCVMYEERKLVLPNDFSLVLPVVKNLVFNTLPIEEKKKYQVILGLNEIINNAIEHGNLGISFEEKRKALIASNFYKTVWQRANREPFKNRVVNIICKIFPQVKKVEYTVTDEGEGFDWKTLPDPKNKENVLTRSGRGITIAKYAFEEVTFNDRGNSVRMVYHTHRKQVQ